MRRFPGFALVELLVVVGIILLLASLVLPALARARDRARVAVCLANFSQISAATNSYAFGNKGYLPYTKEGGKLNRGFCEAFGGDVCLARRLQCPASPGLGPDYGGSLAYWTHPRFLRGDNLPGEIALAFPAILSRARFSSQKVLTAEIYAWHHDVPINREFGVKPHRPGYSSPAGCVDGHAVLMDYYNFLPGFDTGRSTRRNHPNSYNNTIDAFAGFDVSF